MQGWLINVTEAYLFHFAASVSIKSSLKDDDSGDHDQDQGSPKDGEKEKTEDEDKEQNTSKKKVSPLNKMTHSSNYRVLSVNCVAQ